jgi:Flp pilus assembly protein TadG
MTVGAVRSEAARVRRTWAGDRRGATAVEFAMVGLPFMFMIFALIQLALYFMVQVTLDNATAAAARQLRTGVTVADGASDTSAKKSFASSICSNMNWLQSQCSSNLTVDVRPLSGGYGSGLSSQPMGACFYSGGAGSAVELRSQYNWTLPTAILAQSLAGGGGTAQIQSTEVFQVEPDGQSSNSAAQC